MFQACSWMWIGMNLLTRGNDEFWLKAENSFDDKIEMKAGSWERYEDWTDGGCTSKCILLILVVVDMYDYKKKLQFQFEWNLE